MKKIFFLITLFCGISAFSQEEKTVKSDSLKSNEVIENVPVYPGCDELLSNLERKECMSTKISELVNANFNLSLAYTLNLPEGKHRISIQFKINREGNVESVRARAPHPFLEKEAIRVVKLLPKMKPGMQRGKPVIVPYGFPISFQVENDNKNNKTKKQKIIETPESYPVFRGCKEDLEYHVLKNCTKEKIINYIKLSFNMELADKLFPLDKSTQFQVEFIIDKNGIPRNITAKAHKKEIAAEAIKVVKRLPKMKKPAYLNGKPIAVPYKILMTLYF